MSAMISIDFWNTLVKAETGGEKRRKMRLSALKKITENYIDDLSDTKIEEAARKASTEFDRIWFREQRTPTTDELVSLILNYLNVSATPKEHDHLVEAFQESIWEGPPELVNQAKEVLPVLADRYPLAIISDTMYSPGRVIRQYLKSEGVLEYFQAFVFSDETGYSKPNPKAYHKVLRETGCSAEYSWHIGDLLKTDIAGAKKIGMSTILYTELTVHTSEEKEKKETKPDHICSSWGEIRALLC